MFTYLDTLVLQKLVLPLIQWHSAKTDNSRFLLGAAFLNLAVLCITVSIFVLFLTKTLSPLLTVIVGASFAALLWWPGRRVIASLMQYDVEAKRGNCPWDRQYPHEHVFRVFFVSGGLSSLLLVLILIAVKPYVALGVLPLVFGYWSFVAGYYVITTPVPYIRRGECAQNVQI